MLPGCWVSLLDQITRLLDLTKGWDHEHARPVAAAAARKVLRLAEGFGDDVPIPSVSAYRLTCRRAYMLICRCSSGVSMP
ncbi:MAG: hypothetical protein ACYCXA_15480 [Actinomycetes bacterium]